MTRRTSSILFALALIALPRGAAAEPGGTPLRVLCTTSAMDYCASIWSWDFQYRTGEEIEGMPGRALARLFADVELWGHGFVDGPADFFVAMLETGGDSFTLQVSFAPDQVDAGFYHLGDGGPAGYPALPGPEAIGFLHFADHGTFSSCGSGPTAPVCYEVPEPGALLLLATGMLPLALIGWRRRREA